MEAAAPTRARAAGGDRGCYTLAALAQAARLFSRRAIWDIYGDITACIWNNPTITCTHPHLAIAGVRQFVAVMCSPAAPAGE